MIWRGQGPGRGRQYLYSCFRLSPRLRSATRLPIRHLSTKLFVGGNEHVFQVAGLSYDTNETVLKDVFGVHGEIIKVKVMCDTVSGKSKRYGFVQFVSEDAASRALKGMDGQLLDGRNIRVEYANKQI